MQSPNGLAHKLLYIYVYMLNVQGDYEWCERLHKFIGKNHSHHL